MQGIFSLSLYTDVSFASVLGWSSRASTFTAGIALLLDIDGYSDLFQSRQNNLDYTVDCSTFIGSLENIFSDLQYWQFGSCTLLSMSLDTSRAQLV